MENSTDCQCDEIVQHLTPRNVHSWHLSMKAELSLGQMVLTSIQSFNIVGPCCDMLLANSLLHKGFPCMIIALGECTACGGLSWGERNKASSPTLPFSPLSTSAKERGWPMNKTCCNIVGLFYTVLLMMVETCWTEVLYSEQMPLSQCFPQPRSLKWVLANNC